MYLFVCNMIYTIIKFNYKSTVIVCVLFFFSTGAYNLFYFIGHSWFPLLFFYELGIDAWSKFKNTFESI